MIGDWDKRRPEPKFSSRLLAAQVVRRGAQSPDIPLWRGVQGGTRWQAGSENRPTCSNAQTAAKGVQATFWAPAGTNDLRI